MSGKQLLSDGGGADRASGNPAPALSVDEARWSHIEANSPEEAPWLDENKPTSVGNAPHRWFFDVPDGGIVVSARDLDPIVRHYFYVWGALRAATARAERLERVARETLAVHKAWGRLPASMMEANANLERALSATEEGQG